MSLAAVDEEEVDASPLVQLPSLSSEDHSKLRLYFL